MGIENNEENMGVYKAFFWHYVFIIMKNECIPNGK